MASNSVRLISLRGMGVAKEVILPFSVAAILMLDPERYFRV
jgi:hypothetical protein